MVDIVGLAFSNFAGLAASLCCLDINGTELCGLARGAISHNCAVSGQINALDVISYYFSLLLNRLLIVSAP